MIDPLNSPSPVDFLCNHLTRLVKGQLRSKVLIGMFQNIAV